MAFQLGSNFELKQQVPLDTRTVVSNQTELNALIGTNQVYPGLIVYVTSENKYYYRNTSNAWIELNINGGGTIGNANLDFTIINSTTTAAVNTKYGVDTASGTVLLFLPTTPSEGDIIEIIDINNTFDINNLAIDPNGQGLEQQVGILYCDVKSAHFVLVYYNGDWEISVLDNSLTKAGVIDNTSTTPLLFLKIQNNTGGLFDSPDGNNYIIPWNYIEWYDPDLVQIDGTLNSSKIISYDPTNRNLYFSTPGIYNIDLRYSTFNLIETNDFLRARLRSSDSLILNSLPTNPPNPPTTQLPDPPAGPEVLAAFAQGLIGTSFNGEAMQAGFTTFRIDSPKYIVADFLHVGAFNTNTNLSRGFPVFNNVYGNQPFMFVTLVKRL